MSGLLLLVIIAVLVAVAVYFRAEIANIIAGSAYLAAGTFRTVWPAIGNVILIAVGVFFLGWLILAVLIIGLGAYAHAIGCSIAILVLFPIWFLAFIMPPIASRVWILGPVIKVVRYVFSPILAIAVIFLLVGIWSPAVKSSFDRWHKDGKQTVANSLDKRSLQSEAESEILGFLPEETWVYNQNGNPFRKLSQGTLVRALDLRGVPAQPDSEGLVRVMIPNEIGDFIKGNTGYVPSRKIRWDWRDAKTSHDRAADIQRKIELDRKAGELQKNDPPRPIKIQGSYLYGEDPGTTLEPGKYEVVATGSDFKYQNPGGKRVHIGPEGVIGKEVSTQSELFVPSAPFASLIIMIGDGPWQHIGKGAEITVHSVAWVRFTRNLQKSPFVDYKGNVGGDRIKIRRVGQLSTAFFYLM